MEIGAAMTVVMVVMMVLMAGGMVWGAVSAFGSRARQRRERTNRGGDG